MNTDPRPEPADGQSPAAGAVLIECDRQARILWMSEGARAWFGMAGHLMEALRAAAPRGPAGLHRLASAARFSPVFQRGDSVWISAALADRAETAAGPDGLTLLHVQSDFLRHYFRLQAAERQLSTRTRNLRRGAGGDALMQVERERERLARELHSSVGQILAAMRLEIEVIASRQAALAAPVGQALGRISNLAGEALERVRAVSGRLHPPEWQRLRLEDALRQLWDFGGIPQHFESSLALDPLPSEPELAVKILIYRAAQEALSNLVRHSHATRVEMRLERRGPRLVLTVCDNGVGFDAVRLATLPGGPATGIGLRSIREQAAGLGGALAVQSGPDGTKLELSARFPGNGPEGQV